jgi:hypothetical protein
VKQVVQVRLQADAAQLDALARTLIACNETANLVSTIAHRERVFRGRDLRANLRAGRYGTPGSIRRKKVESNPIRFRTLAAQPFDDRCLSWSHDTDTATGGVVSIWTVDGRLKDLRLVGEAGQIALLRTYRSGETDLVIRRRHRGGGLVAYLIATIDLPDPLVRTGAHLDRPDGWIGVDLGIENIAVTSDRTLGRELMTTYGAGAPDGAAGRGSVKDRRTGNRGTAPPTAGQEHQVGETPVAHTGP